MSNLKFKELEEVEPSVKRVKIEKSEYKIIIKGLRLLWYKEKDSSKKSVVENFANRLEEEWNINSPSYSLKYEEDK